MAWCTYTKDINYYLRLNLIRKIKKHVEDNFQINSPEIFTPPITFTYQGGKVNILSIERYKYMSRFKREFTVIRVKLDNNQYVPLTKLRLKHLLKISNIFFN